MLNVGTILESVTRFGSKMPKLTKFTLLAGLILFTTNPASAQTPTPPPGPIYIVQAGDTLSSIAARFNVLLDELMITNDITDPNVISAGQHLIIPGLEGVNGILLTEVVQFGDSFRSLIRRDQVPESLLRKLNHLVSPTELYAGVSLIVPQQEGKPALSTRSSLETGETLLELAVQQDTDPWTIIHINSLDATWVALPGDVLYTLSGNTPQFISGLPSVFASAEVSPLPIVQGGTAEIRVKLSQPATLTGLLVDKPLLFFQNDNNDFVALQGVHAMLDPGVYPLRLEASFPDGNVQSFEQMVLVISGNYPEDPVLFVDPATIDPAVTEPETELLLSIVSEATPQRFWNGIFKTPASAYAESTYFTSRFGNRRTYIAQGTDLKIESFHTGLDFGGGTGLPITAPAAGKIVFAKYLIVRGNATIIDHGWGVYSGLWHQSEIDVQVGDTVDQGQVIGLVGGTGRVTGAHLHWELWVNGIQVNPLDWLYKLFP